MFRSILVLYNFEGSSERRYVTGEAQVITSSCNIRRDINIKFVLYIDRMNPEIDMQDCS